MPANSAWLTPTEAARAARLRLTKRRTEFLLRRWTGKAAVATVCGLPTDHTAFARIDIGNNADGSPYVLVDGAPTGMDISLTDRAGWAICLLNDGGDDDGGDVDGGDDDRERQRRSDQERTTGVGCDLELVEPRSDAFVRTFFTEAEQAYLTTCSDQDSRYLTANLIWSAKESALKVLRTGLRRDTRDVEVRLADTDQLPATGRHPRDELSGAVTGEIGWRTLSVRCPGAVTLPGWWRRDGAFLLTVVASGTGRSPRALEDPGALAAADPIPAAYGR